MFSLAATMDTTNDYDAAVQDPEFRKAHDEELESLEWNGSVPSLDDTLKNSSKRWE